MLIALQSPVDALSYVFYHLPRLSKSAEISASFELPWQCVWTLAFISFIFSHVPFFVFIRSLFLGLSLSSACCLCNPKGKLLYQFARAAIAEYHRLGDNINLFSHISGGWKSKTKVSAGLVSSETPFLGLKMAAFLLCLTWSFLCISRFPLVVRTAVTLDQGLFIGFHFTLITS